MPDSRVESMTRFRPRSGENFRPADFTPASTSAAAWLSQARENARLLHSKGHNTHNAIVNRNDNYYSPGYTRSYITNTNMP